MEITVLQKSQYGTAVYHPVNEAAKALASITGTKTLTYAVLQIAVKQLGATLTVTHPSTLSQLTGLAA